MNEYLKNEAALNPEDLEEVTGGVYRPHVIGKAEEKPLKRVFCKKCHSTFQAEYDDPNPKCPFCAENKSFSV